MSKAPAKKPVSAKKISFRRHLRQIMGRQYSRLLVLIVLGIAVWVGVHIAQVHAERNKFLQARTDLHTLAQQIIQQVGQPTQQKAEQSCGYKSREFERGPRYCDVNEFLFYGSPTKEDAKKMAQKIEGVISKSDIAENYLVANEELWPEDLASSNFSVKGLSQCGSQSIFLSDKAEAGEYPGFIKSSYPGASVMLFCTGSAKAEYFPVEND